MSNVTGQELLEIANGCYSSRRGEYVGLQFRMAVNEAVEAKTKGGDKLKVRREHAVHLVSTIFDHAREQQVSRLTLIAGEASGGSRAGSGDSELQAFAAEVAEILQPISRALFGLEKIDPITIVTIITSIIQAIAACRHPAPVPTPTPVPVPAM